MSKKPSERDMLDLLERKFSPPSWALFEQVADQTGSATGWADAMAMGLWRSRGLHLHGFEVKVSRRDWLAELRQPEKAESFIQFCDRWWLVVPDASIVHDGELPETWGLMVKAKNGRGLSEKIKAPALDPLPLDKPMLAALLRRADECVREREKRFDAEVNRRIRETGLITEEQHESRMASLSEQYVRLKQQVEAFEQASGLRIDRFGGGDRLGEEVKAVRELRRLANPNGRRAMRQAISALKEAQEKAETAQALFEEANTASK